MSDYFRAPKKGEARFRAEFESGVRLEGVVDLVDLPAYILAFMSPDERARAEQVIVDKTKMKRT